MRRSLRPAVVGALVFGLACGGVLEAALAAEVIDNPAEPAQGRDVIHPVQNWALGGTNEREEEFFGVVRRAAVGADGTTYLLDEQLHEVRAFDASGALVAVFGREGGGPGEFNRPRDIFVLPDGRVGVVHGFPARISTFLPDGSIAADLSIGASDEPAMIFELQAVNGRLAAVRNRVQRNDSSARITRTLVAIGADGAILTTYLEQTEEIPMNGGRRGPGGGGPRMMLGEDFLVSWSLGPDGSLYLVRATDRYEIEVRSPDGTAQRTLRRAYEHVPRTKAERAALERRERENAERMGISPQEIAPYRNDIARVIARADGSLWVLPSSGLAREDDGVLGVFDVFDAAGRFVRQVEIAVPFRPLDDEFALVGDTLFVFEQSVDAARGMMAGRRGSASEAEVDDADEEEEEPRPLRIVRYHLLPRS